MLLLQAQGALLTGTSGFLEINKNSRNTTLCLIHRLHCRWLILSLIVSSTVTLMTSLTYCLFSLVYSLPTILVYQSSQWLAHLTYETWINFLGSRNRNWVFFFLNVPLFMWTYIRRLVYLKYISGKKTFDFARVSQSLSYWMLLGTRQSRYDPV